MLLRALGAPTDVQASTGARPPAGAWWFVPADVVVEVTALGVVTHAPGLIPPVSGIALARGAVATVIDIGAIHIRADSPGPPPESEAPARRPGYRSGDDWPLPGSERAVLCNLAGELVALCGGRVVATGTFDATEGGVMWQGSVVPTLDVRALYAHAEQAIWTARAAARTRAVAP
ncbi:MAG: hypothetical protein WKG00_41910 [Polyangiaceae bacterium]